MDKLACLVDDFAVLIYPNSSGPVLQGRACLSVCVSHDDHLVLGNCSHSTSGPSRVSGAAYDRVCPLPVQADTPISGRVSFHTSFSLRVCKAWSHFFLFIVQELCESRGGRPGLSVLTSLLVFVDVKIY